MGINLKNYDWDGANDALSDFDERSIRVADSGLQALIHDGDYVMGILKIYEGEKNVCLHLRASVQPQVAGYLAAVIFAVVPLVLDTVFEYNHNGDMLTGQDALEFAANNIKELWFGFDDKKVGSEYDRPDFLN